MAFQVKEIYYTLQGEGAQAGRPAVFCRFAGCNLWSGREEDREAAVCTFCDTDFVGTDGPGGGRFEDAESLARAVAAAWPEVDVDGEKGHERARRYVVCTGGEPLLQMNDALVSAFHEEGFAVAVETNGTLPPPGGLDWICVSPKADAEVVLRRGDELKLVYPQAEVQPETVSDWAFSHFFLQPMDGPARVENTEKTIAYCLRHPQWRLSLQTHKLLGIP